MAEENKAGKKQPPRRSEKAGIFNFAKEMISALLMAFVAIVYVIQAFKIPTGSMEDSLLVGDFLLGLKFIYGAPVIPFSYTKFPGVTKPKPGDVVIFKYPGADKKDYIKRCVAGPGQTIETKGESVLVDDKTVLMPPKGKHIRHGHLDSMVTNFAKIRIPAQKDRYIIDTCSIRDFIFLKHLVHQEHPRSVVTARYDLYVDSTLANNQPIIRSPHGYATHTFDQILFDKIDNWTIIQSIFNQISSDLAGHEITLKKSLYLDNKPLETYEVKNDNYFMMGDNRDNSMDSRYWGFVNRKFIKAKAFIIYFSLNKETPLILLPLKIRWQRIGKLIRGWDGSGK